MKPIRPSSYVFEDKLRTCANNITAATIEALDDAHYMLASAYPADLFMRVENKKELDYFSSYPASDLGVLAESAHILFVLPALYEQMQSLREEATAFARETGNSLNLKKTMGTGMLVLPHDRLKDHVRAKVFISLMSGVDSKISNAIEKDSYSVISAMKDEGYSIGPLVESETSFSLTPVLHEFIRYAGMRYSEDVRSSLTGLLGKKPKQAIFERRSWNMLVRYAGEKDGGRRLLQPFQPGKDYSTLASRRGLRVPFG